MVCSLVLTLLGMCGVSCMFAVVVLGLFYRCKDSVSRLLPREFEETYLRIYCKSKQHVSLVKTAYESWCANQAQADRIGASPEIPSTPTTPTRKRKATH